MAASTTPVATTSLESSSLSQSDEALKVAVFQRLHPRAYLERFLAENIRPDKRLCDGFRDVHVNVGEFIFFFFEGGIERGNTISPPSPCYLFFDGFLLTSAMDEEVRFHLNCRRVLTCSNGKYYSRLWSQS